MARLTSSAQTQFGLWIVVSGIVSLVAIIGIGYATHMAWESVTASVASTGKVGKADRLWESGEKAKAVDEYERILALETNPMFGTEISAEQRPVMLVRIVEIESTRDNKNLAKKFLAEIAQRNLWQETIAATTDKATADLLVQAESGEKLLTELRQIKEDHSQKNPSKPDEVLAKLQAVGFDPRAFPWYTPTVLQQANGIVNQISDQQLKKSLSQWLASWDNKKGEEKTK